MENEVPVRFEDGPPATLVERLTANFYAWERRGRGWPTWDRPVGLEPPFRPFYFPIVQPPPAIDDGRRPTWLSSALERFRARRSGSPVVSDERPELLEQRLEEPEPDPFVEAGDLVALPVSLPPETKVSREAAEGLLLTLSSVSSPVGFEVLGSNAGIHVQFVGRGEDVSTLRQQIPAFFPEAGLTEEPGLPPRPNAEGTASVIFDFGLSNEFMLPLRVFNTFEVDPLAGVVGALDGLQHLELGILQILFQPVRHPWAEHALWSVTDGEGGPFFLDAPHVLPLAKEKLSKPLFAAVVRVVASAQTEERAWTIARQMGGALRQYSRPSSNELIPLSGADYPGDEHEVDLLERRSRRSGMLLNVTELASLVHPPSATVRSERLKRECRVTAKAPAIVSEPGPVLGENVHRGARTEVHLPTSLRLRHTHVVGATGTGKSHLLRNLVLQDIEAGEGVGVLDPHGDLIDRILERIPEARHEDVVLFDPADEEYPIAFNILSAHSEVERRLLASDLVAVFRRLATSWGDQMTSVLRNAVLAFLESEEGGTLADLRRFLVEPQYRASFLETVRDPEIVYFWQREFPLLSGRPQAPLLTRLDSFLAPKPLRRMVSQPESSLDFTEIMDGGRIFLARLAQGVIGEENSHLLGSLLAAKFQQLATARQIRPEAERRPFYLYVDEFQHFATPSMAQILGGTRKYGLGLTLAHQDLAQLDKAGPALSSAALSNPATRIAFRVGDADAKKLSDGFARFDARDLTNLERGEAICRIERSDWSFNLETLPLPDLQPAEGAARAAAILEASRKKYGVRAEATEPGVPRTPQRREATPRAPAEEETEPRAIPPPSERVEHRPASKRQPRPTKPPRLGKGGPEHTELQERVKRWAGNRGWLVTIEQPVLDGRGRVDVALERGEWTVAVEISISSSAEDELGNAEKCLEAGFDDVVVVYPSRTRLRNAEERITEALEEDERERVHFLTPEGLWAFLEEREARLAGVRRTVEGWAVETRYRPVDPDEGARHAAGVFEAFRRLWSKKR